jgi:hypothetical protein
MIIFVGGYAECLWLTLKPSRTAGLPEADVLKKRRKFPRWLVKGILTVPQYEQIEKLGRGGVWD